LTGLSIGEGIAGGKVCRLKSADEIDQFEDGAILVTEMTDPDWVPVMKRAAGIVTEHGGRTCHAAIVSRELGVARIAASQYPEPVIVRMSDFKTNEYADLIGGRQFEPEENNPMLVAAPPAITRINSRV